MSQNRKPLPPQTAHKAWAAAGGALLGNLVLGAVLALTRWVLGEPIQIDPAIAGHVYALATAAVTAGGAWLGAYLKSNWQIDLSASGLRCHPAPVLIAVALTLLVAACQPGAAGRVGAAVERVAQRIDVACQTLDGEAVTLGIDVVAAAAGQTDRVELARGVRQRLCADAGLIEALAPAVAPAPAARK